MFECDFMGSAISPVFALGCIALAVVVVGWALLTVKGFRAAYRWWTAPVPPCPVAAVILEKMETEKCTSESNLVRVGNLTIYTNSGRVYSDGEYLDDMMTWRGKTAVQARAVAIRKRLYAARRMAVLNNALKAVEKKPDVFYRAGDVYVDGKVQG